MGKDKLRRFNELLEYPNYYQCDNFEAKTAVNSAGESKRMNGIWRSSVFQNENPLVLELACGKGHYTVGLAKLDANQNYLGIDIKGARMYVGATQALQQDLKNVAFCRMHIEHIESFFNAEEVDEIWITFPDPQKEPRRAKKRLVHPRYLAAYARILKPGGIIHLKTDSTPLADYMEEVIQELGIKPISSVRDIDTWDGFNDKLAIVTDYERMNRDLGSKIKYYSFKLPEAFVEKSKNEESAFTKTP